MNTARNLQILACAGSGKTEVLAQRVAHLLTRHNNPLAPANIVAFTFTNKAADELRRRHDFILNGEDELTADVLDVLGSLDPAELYHLDTLIGFLEAAGVELPTTKAGEVMKNDLARAIRTAFPGASSRKRRRPGEGREGKACHLWQGVGAKGNEAQY